MMTTPYTLVHDLVHQTESPVDGTLSRTIYQDERLKVVLFGFNAGQELSEHTASTPAIMHFLRGDAEITLGSDKCPLVMLLYLLKYPATP